MLRTYEPLAVMCLLDFPDFRVSLVIEFAFDELLCFQLRKEIPQASATAAFDHAALVHLVELHPDITDKLPCIGIERLNHLFHEIFDHPIHVSGMGGVSFFLTFGFGPAVPSLPQPLLGHEGLNDEISSQHLKMGLSLTLSLVTR